VNGLGYNFLQKKLYDRSYEFFQLNINNYPESFNVYDSMSDLYIAENKKEKAIECLKKELALKEIPYAREKLGKLEKNK
jgi:hypothetical protein